MLAQNTNNKLTRNLPLKKRLLNTEQKIPIYIQTTAFSPIIVPDEISKNTPQTTPIIPAINQLPSPIEQQTRNTKTIFGIIPKGFISDNTQTCSKYEIKIIKEILTYFIKSPSFLHYQIHLTAFSIKTCFRFAKSVYGFITAYCDTPDTSDTISITLPKAIPAG